MLVRRVFKNSLLDIITRNIECIFFHKGAVFMVRILLFAAIVFALFFAFSDKKSITIYRVEKVNDKYFPLNPQMFYMSSDKQSILFRARDGGIEKMKCTVINIENWKCRYSDNTGDVSMEDGLIEQKVASALPGLPSKITKQVNIFKYYLLKHLKIDIID